MFTAPRPFFGVVRNEPANQAPWDVFDRLDCLIAALGIEAPELLVLGVLQGEHIGRRGLELNGDMSGDRLEGDLGLPRGHNLGHVLDAWVVGDLEVAVPINRPSTTIATRTYNYP